MARYCSHCGKKINDNALFCKFCGEKTEETTESKVNVAASEGPEEPARKSSGDEVLPKKMKIIIVAAFVMVVITVAIGLLMYFVNTNNGNNEVADSENDSEQSREEENTIPEEAITYDGHHYCIYNDSMSWTDAKENCEKMGGHLLTINGAGEQNFIVGQIEKDGIKKHHYWLGGTDSGKEGEWRWITGEPFEYTNWDPGYGDEHDPQPNDADNQDYLELQTISNTPTNYMTWNDICESGDNGNNQGMPWYYMQYYFGYICEWED